jgi:DNA polymerase-1
MIDAFKKGLDIHAATAAKAYMVLTSVMVTPEMRRNAKAVNYGIRLRAMCIWSWHRRFTYQG